MKNLTKIFFLFLIVLVGCGTPTIQQTVTIAATEENNPPQALPNLMPQLTYISSPENNFGEIYALDITCITNSLLCFGKPYLVLKTPERTSSTISIDAPGDISDYAWSPDGKKIALCATGLSGRNDIFFADMEQYPPKWINLTHSSINECDPIWDKSGDNIFYRTCDDRYGGCQIFRSSLSGDEKKLWFKNDYLDFYDLSADGKKIVFTKTDPKGYDQICVSDLDGSNFQRVTSGDWDNHEPSFSPDGQVIVFVRWNKPQTVDAPDQADIIVRDLTTGVEKNITEKIQELVVSPVFSPDGKWIAFNSLDPKKNEAVIFAYSIEKSVLIQVTPNNTYSAKPFWRWSYVQ